MPSKIKDICNAINREQKQTIRDFTSGHLNENHLYRPIQLENGRRKAIWATSTKPHPTMRPYHRLETHSSKVEQMKESLLEFAYLTLPQLPKKRITTNRIKVILMFVYFYFLNIDSYYQFFFLNENLVR